MDMMGKGEEKALQRAPPGAQEKEGGGGRLLPTPSHPIPWGCCGARTHSGGAEPAGCHWEAKSSGCGFASAPWAFLKQRSFCAPRPPWCVCGGRREEKKKKKKRKEGKTKITIKKAFCCSRRFRGWFEEAAAALSAASRSLVKALRRRRRRKRRAGASGHKSRQERHKYGRCALGGSEGESRR